MEVKPPNSLSLSMYDIDVSKSDKEPYNHYMLYIISNTIPFCLKFMSPFRASLYKSLLQLIHVRESHVCHL